jgi:hypothetical protein
MPAPVKRVFCRFRSLPPPGSTAYSELPADGMCLSAFLLVEEKGRPGHVLVGQPDPSAPWNDIGALDRERVRALGDRWMLPACHLLLHEGPDTAARRIASEQLERPDLALTGPLVVSDAYSRPETKALGPHWDLDFIFRGAVAPGALGRPRAWRALRFVDAAAEPSDRFARAHADILSFAGLRPTGP